MVSGRYYLPKAPVWWRKEIPEAAVASTKRMGPEGRWAEALAMLVPSRHKRRQRQTLPLGMRDQKTGTTGLHPHLEKHGCRPYQEEGVKRSVDRLVQAEHHLERGDGKHGYALAELRTHRGFGIGDHEEDEELVHGSGDGRDFRAPGVAGDPAAQECESEEG